MFMKKLVEKAAQKKPGAEGLKANDINTSSSPKKKKGMFGSSLFKTKSKSKTDTETESTYVKELDIDDIDIDGHHDQQQQKKHKGILSGVSKKKIVNKFSNLKGKLKQKTTKNEKSVVVTNEEEKNGVATVDQIKKKYGFATSEEMGAAKMAQSKLQDNLKKLQGISLRTTELEDAAKSFSSTAKELLNAVESNKHNSKS